MKALACLAILALALVGCSYHSETVVQKRPDTATVVVPDAPPPTTTTTIVSTP
jgi:hypothetical protein